MREQANDTPASSFLLLFLFFFLFLRDRAGTAKARLLTASAAWNENALRRYRRQRMDRAARSLAQRNCTSTGPLV